MTTETPIECGDEGCQHYAQHEAHSIAFDDVLPLIPAPPPPDVQRDAERYRWLRNQVEFYDGVGCFPELHGKRGQSVDEAIDAARAAQAKEGGL